MKKKCAALFLAAMLASLAVGCVSGPPAQPVQPVKLAELNWDPFNRTQLENFLNANGKNSADYNPEKRPYAVFDWDNTMVFLDIEEATFIYQLKNLRYGATPEQMNAALRKDIPASNFNAAYNNAAGQPLNIDLVATDAVESYTWIYNNYKGLKGSMPIEEIRKNPHYMNFITKTRYLYDAIGDTFDVAVSYPWVLYQFAGMSEAQVRKLVSETVEWQVSQAVEKVKWTSPDSLPGVAGVVSVSWKNGLRLVPEMQDLYRAFREAGIDIWICSASFVDVVREISSNPRYGYLNPEDRVIGMELERDPAGLIQVEFRRGYDQTQGKGKTKAIERFLVSKYGYGPIFVAGDSEGDMNMMQDFSDTRLVLIVNRLKGKDIATLSKQAFDSYGKPDARVILQGRNENTGLFVRSQANVKFGAAEGQVLK